MRANVDLHDQPDDRPPTCDRHVWVKDGDSPVEHTYATARFAVGMVAVTIFTAKPETLRRIAECLHDAADDLADHLAFETSATPSHATVGFYVEDPDADLGGGLLDVDPI